MTDSTACASGCGRPAPGATLCPTCTAQLRATLELAATLEEDLQDATARLLRHGASGKNASTEAPMPIDLRASDAATALNVELATAIHVMLPARAWSATDHTMTGMARWLLMHMPELARHDRAATIATRIRDALQRCVRVLDPPPELHPAGECEACGARLLAEAGADQAECRCGFITSGLNAAKLARADAADVLGDSEFVSRFLAGLGVRVSGGVIRMWITRKRLVPRPDGKVAVSDVLALAAERDQKR